MESNPLIDWETIFLQLTAFAKSLAKGKPWFRGGDATFLFQGKEDKDYAMDAIEKYINEPEKFDPLKGDLLSYLKFNLIRSQIGNDLRRMENKTTIDVYGYQEELESSDDDNGTYVDRILPFIMPFFEDNFDYNLIKEYIEKRIAGDTIAENILLGYSESMKRREIIEEFGMSTNEYDNGVRRLNTAIELAKSHFNQ